jgi:hypothetical protein
MYIFLPPSQLFFFCFALRLSPAGLPCPSSPCGVFLNSFSPVLELDEKSGAKEEKEGGRGRGRMDFVLLLFFFFAVVSFPLAGAHLLLGY